MWKIGDVIDCCYEIRDVFATGGMGIVYRVYHRLWNINLALKQPRINTHCSESSLKQFRHECEVWAGLSPHSHVVSCYYVKTLNNVLSVFTEFVDGGNLSDWIHTRKLYSGNEDICLARILDFAIQSAWGLEHAHGAGLIHQDVKPGNMLVMAEGTVKVTDFGLAHAAGADFSQNGASSSSAFVSVNGMTPAFCSPEQALRERVSYKTDIYSWGVSVLEMFMGEVTWASGMAAKYALDEIRDRAPASYIPDIPIAVFDLLSDCLSENPERRPNGFRDIADRLQCIFFDIFREPHRRMRPDADLAALDACNNRALALLDLGHPKAEAERLLLSVLQRDPKHPQAKANLALIRAEHQRGSYANLQLAKPMSGLEYYEEQRKFERLCLKLKRAIATGRKQDAIRYLQQVDDLGSFERHPRIQELKQSLREL